LDCRLFHIERGIDAYGIRCEEPYRRCIRCNSATDIAQRLGADHNVSEIPDNIIIEASRHMIELLNRQAVHQFYKYFAGCANKFKSLSIPNHIVNTLSCSSKNSFGTISGEGSSRSNCFNFVWKPALFLMMAIR